MFVKICGITNLEDAILASELGADAIGFIFYEGSPRYIEPKIASAIITSLSKSIRKVGVFVNQDIFDVRATAKNCNLDMVQLHGDETVDYCKQLPDLKVIKGFRIGNVKDISMIADYKTEAFLLDSKAEKVYGGSGEVFDWNLAVEAKKYGPVILSGGLNPENVGQAIKKVRPYGVDTASGIEKQPGVKDPTKLKQFIERARTRAEDLKS